MHQRKLPGAVLLGSDFKALGVARSLGQRGIPSVVVDTLPRSAWFSRYVIERFKWEGQMDDEQFVSFLLKIGKQYPQWILFPMQDEVVQLVARHRQELAQIYQPVPQGWEVIQWAADKRLTYRMAQETGVPFPRTAYPRREDELAAIDVPFPLIIKPAISVHLQYTERLKALPAHCHEELLTQYRRAVKSIPPDEVMVQEIVPGDGRTQYSVAAFCTEGQIVAGMTARRTRQYPIDYGLGSSFVEAIEVPVLFEQAQKLLRFMRVSGMVEVEFKQDRRDQQYKLLDINVRPWGWHTLCIACGLDFPYLQYCATCGQEQAIVPTSPQYDHHWVRLLTDIPAGLQEIRAGITTPGAYLRSLGGKTVFSVLDWHDPLPALGDFFVVLSRLARASVQKIRI
ncbi:MAG: ATP-grasp domain-containing protein [Ktedonobacteraceae bacterium]|nr:ATP-grasp domain-containing protein [Ktedonobacteraceae bacterium]